MYYYPLLISLLLLASAAASGSPDQEQRRPPLTASRRSPYGRDGLDSLKESLVTIGILLPGASDDEMLRQFRAYLGMIGKPRYGRSIRFKPRAN
ncbi:hypothetical protein BOX15_Mlig008914g1 [Macrostomum lignano]|uniref:Uncharacterized protein n=1 Tax=Macrostomum lignano TaxID=282301 RepID=A0A267FW40_9PLAT|nr:hypothetical protein BOX15_Mlig008914g1 [Macrostomum lignano]